MQRGRKPKPKARIYQPGEVVAPEVPVDLRGLALLEWDRIVVELRGANLLDRADRALIERYCRAYGRAAVAREALEEYGVVIETDAGLIKSNPAAGVLAAAETLMIRCLVELGLSPASRARVKPPEPVAADPLEQFLAKA
jgi:P27 family predicted phage terminase small subunit